MLAMAVAVMSCSSDDDGGNGGGSTPGGTYVKAKVGGTMNETYRIQGISVATAITNGTGDGRLIMIGGSIDQMGTKAWSINLLGINAEGEYSIGPDSNSTVAYVENQVSYDNSNCAGATGTVNITHIDDEKVEGTFSLTAKNDEDCSQTRTITEGSFRGVFMNN